MKGNWKGITMTLNIPPTAVIRLSRGNFDPNRFAEVERMTHHTGTYLIPAITRLDAPPLPRVARTRSPHSRSLDLEYQQSRPPRESYRVSSGGTCSRLGGGTSASTLVRLRVSRPLMKSSRCQREYVPGAALKVDNFGSSVIDLSGWRATLRRPYLCR
jgi:hypothetical protein